jgi:hypothetical protein
VACPGRCAKCAGGTTCGLLAAGSQGACSANHACNAAGVCENANGQACNPANNGSDCASGFCSGGDDFCCAVTCAGPCAKCAGGTTCGLLAAGSPGACGSGKVCDAAGACVAGLSGSGTASDPYTSTPPLAKCSVYLSTFPTAQDGVYTINPGSGAINVYCDMVHGGITYANFGMGPYTGSFAGWTFVGAADFSGTAELAAAFAYLYDRNGGLTNLQVGFSVTNCCIENTTTTNWYGIDGSSYMYPWMSGAENCGGPYSAALLQLGDGVTSVEISPATLTPSQAGTVATFGGCSNGGNPAIFVQKY